MDVHLQDPSPTLSRLKPGNGLTQEVTYEYITVLCRNPYGQRVWIQQEFTLGKHTIVIYVKQELDKTLLDKVIRASVLVALRGSGRWSVDLRVATERFFSASNNVTHMLSIPSSTLTRLLVDSNGPDLLGSYEASDKRDMVYGLLSIASDSGALHITTDYTKRWQDVYREVTEAYIMLGDLTLLSFTGLATIPSDLPTWVQDWSQQRNFEPILQHGKANNMNNFSLYSAATSESTSFSFPREGQLNLKGCFVDHIRKTSRPINDYFVENTWWDIDIYQLHSNILCDLYLENNSWDDDTSPYGEDRLATRYALLCSLTAGIQQPHTFSQYSRPTRWTFSCNFDLLAKSILGLSEKINGQAEIFESFRRVVALYMDKVLFVTGKAM
jgi:hypothetical protein